MKVFIPALALAILITASAFAPSAYARRRSFPSTIRSVPAAIPVDRGNATLIARAGPTRDVRYARAEARWVVSSREARRQSTLRASARGTVHFDEQLLLSPL